MTRLPRQDMNRESVRSKHRLALVALCLAQFGLVLGFQGTAISLPDVEQGLSLSGSASQWLISANALAFGGLLLPAGRAADLFGHRRMFMLGSALFALASLAAGLAPSFEWLIVARVLQGAGTAFSTPATIALLADLFPEGPERRKALAFWGAAGPLGGVGAVLLGGALAATFGWRAVFLLGAPVTIPALFLARTVLPDVAGRRRGRLDLPGAVAGTFGIGVLVYSLGAMSGSGGISMRTLGTFLLGLSLLGVFLRFERTSTSPQVPRSLIGRPGVWQPIAVSFFQGASTNTPIVFYSLFMQNIRGASPWETGLGFIPCNLALIAGAAIGSRIAGRTGTRFPMAFGMAVVAVGLISFVTVSQESTYVTTLLPGMILYGGGFGIAQFGVVSGATGAAKADERGAVSGLVSTAAQIGTAIGLALLVIVSGQATGELEGIRLAFIGAALLALVGSIASLSRMTWLRPGVRARVRA